MSRGMIPWRIRVPVFFLTRLCANKEKCVSILSSRFRCLLFKIDFKSSLKYYEASGISRRAGVFP